MKKTISEQPRPWRKSCEGESCYGDRVYGIFLGVIAVTGEAIIGTHNGTVRARTIKRLPEATRRDKDMIMGMRGTPWSPDGESSERIGIRIDIPTGGIDVLPVHRDLQTKRVYLTKADFNMHITDGCPGCAAIKRGLSKSVNHNDKCRARIEKAHEGTPEGADRPKRANDRQNEAEDKINSKKFKMSADGSTGRGGERHDHRGDHHGAPGATPAASSSKASSSSSTASSSSTTPHAPAKAEEEAAGHQAADEDMIEIEPEAKRPRLLNLQAPVSRPVVSEVFSPPRVAAMAENMGMKSGDPLDISTVSNKGEPWDFDRKDKRDEARRLIQQSKPRLLIGSPMCTAFPALQNRSRERMGEERWKEVTVRATIHLEFVCSLYKEQIARDDYFLHEHPATATSWSLKCIGEVMAIRGVSCTTGDMCAYGMRQVGG